ncbi:MAG: 3-hydroxyacyl-CoA dehydrogenase NAD-binding domain-containing protein [Bacteroidota bacterium]|nr:3-hydroxyacyl-CoA dehydrogenase NAD-binding domain-containing protein [Bacteroidota bacterium]
MVYNSGFLPLRKAAVLGAGTMGAQIAAHLANAGLEVLLLDMPAAAGQPANRVVERNLKAATRLKPDPLFTASTRQRITCANFRDDWARIADADWVIEAVIERPEIKQSIMATVESHARSDAIISTNTSGIPIRVISKGRSAGFKRRFLGTHFFNPPRYLRLLEIIPGEATDPNLVSYLRWYGRVHLGKGTVIAKDVPYFIGNRIGIYGMMGAMAEFAGRAYTIEEIDALTGPLVGRPKSATFRTADLVGLDVMRLVGQNLYESVPHDESRDRFSVPPLVDRLVAMGALGAKTRAGFYRKEGRVIKSINPVSGRYEPPAPMNLGDLKALRQAGGLHARLQALYQDQGRAGAFFRRTSLDLMGYAARRIGEITDSPAAVDQAMRWGFGWKLGPFEMWDVLGFDRVRSDMGAADIALPDWVTGRPDRSSFYGRGGRRVYVPADGTFAEVDTPADERGPAILKAAGQADLWSNREAGLVDLGKDVALFEFRSKACTLGRRVIRGLVEAIDYVECNANLRGMVVGNEGTHFSVGANLAEMAQAVGDGQYRVISDYIVEFQRAMQRVHYARKPVVAAVHQRALGGGCELVMSSCHPVAAAESYLGLVELGVGLIPAGTGCMRLAGRASERHAAYDSDLQPFVARFYEQVAKAEVSTSAERAREMAYIPDHTPIVMNAARRFHVAIEQVLHLSEQGYRPPVTKAIRVLGRPGAAAMSMGVYQLHQGRFISDYDRFLADRLAYVMTGGDLSGPHDVTEAYLLDLEREVFLSLLGQPKTQERVIGLLKTNRPIRN